MAWNFNVCLRLHFLRWHMQIQKPILAHYYSRIIISLGKIKPRPHVSIFVWKHKSWFLFLPSVHTYIQWKRSPKTQIFENAFQSGNLENAVFFVFSCGHPKTELFENDEVMRSNSVHWACACFIIEHVYCIAARQSSTMRRALYKLYRRLC